jgi:Rrf2 family protein
MKLSKRGEYALRALIDLGLAREAGRNLLQASELAAKEQLPIKFLEQILQELRDAGYIESVRGKFGGYRLAKSTDAIFVGEIVRLIDGPLAPIGCVSQTAYCPCTCPDEDHCGLRLIMLDVRNAIAGILDRYTLADIVGVTLRKMRSSGVPHPYAAEAAGADDVASAEAKAIASEAVVAALAPVAVPLPRPTRAAARAVRPASSATRARRPASDLVALTDHLNPDYTI